MNNTEPKASRRPTLSITVFAVLTLLFLGGTARVQAQTPQWTPNASNNSITTTGNVGIGTTGPAEALHVRKDQNLSTSVLVENQTAGPGAQARVQAKNDLGNLAQIAITSSTMTPYGAIAANNAYLYTQSPSFVLMADHASGIIKFAAGGSAERMRIDSAGNVGIGTTSPGSLLHVATAATGYIPAFKLEGTANPGNGATRLTLVNPQSWVGLSAYGSGSPGVLANAGGLFADAPSSSLIIASGSNMPIYMFTNNSFTAPHFTINTAGNVGIGTTSPGYKLDVAGTAGLGQAYLNNSDVYFTNTGHNHTGIGNTGGYAAIENAANYNTLMILGRAGGIGDVRSVSIWDRLDVNGNLNTTGAITGGTIHATYQDVAEWVESSQTLPAGTVVVLDHTKSNQVIASTVSYDTRVAGVISTKPGIALGESGEAKVLVATTGRVKVKVDATLAPIQVGDLLVTSDKEGVAMKSLPINVAGIQLHRPGTLIGKALEPLAKGQGEILVLLSLQ